MRSGSVSIGGRAQEQHQHRVVERDEEGEQRAGEDAGPALRQHDFHVALTPVGAHDARGFLGRRVDAFEHRADRAHHEGNRERDMAGDDHAPSTSRRASATRGSEGRWRRRWSETAAAKETGAARAPLPRKRKRVSAIAPAVPSGTAMAVEMIAMMKLVVSASCQRRSPRTSAYHLQRQALRRKHQIAAGRERRRHHHDQRREQKHQHRRDECDGGGAQGATARRSSRRPSRAQRIGQQHQRDDRKQGRRLRGGERPVVVGDGGMKHAGGEHRQLEPADAEPA